MGSSLFKVANKLSKLYEISFFVIKLCLWLVIGFSLLFLPA